MKTQHTPGPWVAEGYLNLTVNAILPEGKATIFLMPGGRLEASKEELQANARLIAAAPKLLAALERVAEYHVPGINPLADAAVLSARAAINKARGA